MIDCRTKQVIIHYTCVHDHKEFLSNVSYGVYVPWSLHSSLPTDTTTPVVKTRSMITYNMKAL